MTSFQLRVGSLLVPSQPIRMENTYLSQFGDFESQAQNGRAPEMYAHLLEAIGQSVSDLDLECCLNDSIYGNNVATCQLNINNGVAFGNGLTAHAEGEPTDGRYYKAVADGAQSGFAWGVDLESFSGSSCSGPLQSGTNTLGLNIFAIMKSEGNLTSNENTGALPSTYTNADDGYVIGLGGVGSKNTNVIVPVIADTWCHFDMVLSISGGIMSARF